MILCPVCGHIPSVPVRAANGRACPCGMTSVVLRDSDMEFPLARWKFGTSSDRYVTYMPGFQSIVYWSPDVVTNFEGSYDLLAEVSDAIGEVVSGLVLGS